MIILGIDTALASSGYAVYNTDTESFIELGWIKTTNKNTRGQRLYSIFQEVDGLNKFHNPDVVAVEDQIYQRNTETLKTLSQAGGVVLLACYDRDIYLYKPKEVKLAAALKGNASKDMVANVMYDLYQKDATLNDFLDKFYITIPFTEKDIKKINDVTDAMAIITTFLRNDANER